MYGSFSSAIIRKDDFLKDSIEEVEFNIASEPFDFPFESGTQIILSSFTKIKWEQFDFAQLKEEIERHFELLLTRQNLSVRLINNGVEYRCLPFDYSKFDEETIGKSFQLELGSTKAKSYSKEEIKFSLDTLIGFP